MTVSTPEPAATLNTFVAYDYATEHVPHAVESIYRDTYEGFGWKTESVESPRAIRPLPLLPAIRPDRVTLKFKRDQRIGNSPMVQEMQKKADDSLAAIGRMERQKNLAPRIVSAALGVIGAVFLALSMFLGPAGGLAIAVGAVGLATWIGGCAAYFGVKAHRRSVLAPRIQHEKDIIRSVGEQATRMMT
ncbi:hypothetical protein ACFYVR_18845 [Rhodococcus sp. NPDC003318]|uniref:hypothetical protein n=1 Tax=Rhodococcus sp. NPDC003318 TaxID=3364503 RepID=UPI003693AF35